MTPSEAPSYPPDQHVTRDLDPTIARRDGVSTISIPIVPEILDATGTPRAGVLATIVDIVAGESAIRAVLPQWIATSSLSLQLDALPSEGHVRATPRVIRHGRTTLVIEVGLETGLATEAEAKGRPLGLATLGFAILPKRNELQARVAWAEDAAPLSRFATEGSGLRAPLLDRIGLEPDPDDPATCRIAVVPYLMNTLGALQGGIVATLLEATGERFAASRLDRPVRVRSLEIHYLKLARVGPIRARARSLARLGDGLLVRVEVFDDGAGGELLDVGTLVVDAAPGLP